MPRIKIVSKQGVLWRRQLPAWGNHWGDCEFLFDADASEYDYLVVFDEPPGDSIRYTCPRANTLLVITEPISIKLYPTLYTRQFGTVISHQEPFAVRHPRVLHTQTAFPWCYGLSHGAQSNLHKWPERGMGFDDLAAMPPPPKTKLLSTVCSHKGAEIAVDDHKHMFVFHGHRVAFTQALGRDLPQLDFFGRDHQPIADKADAINPYKYHLTIENYDCDHWWTEKLADSYLGYSLPIFHGCPNLANYFPKQSFIRINIYNYAEALQTIRHALQNGEYEKRLPAIAEARHRLLHEHNLFALFSRVVQEMAKPPANPPQQASPAGGIIERRKAFRRPKHLLRVLPYLDYKLTRARKHRFLKQKIALQTKGETQVWPR